LSDFQLVVSLPAMSSSPLFKWFLENASGNSADPITVLLELTLQ